MSSRLSKIATAALAATVLVATAADAFAIRNRYTNEQNEGFTGLLFGGFAPYWADDQPLYRPYRGRPAFAPDYDAPPPPRYRGPVAPYSY